MSDSERAMIAMFKGLDDENRVEIVSLLKDGELCAADLLRSLHITQPTLSHHMKVLRRSGLVTSRKQGKWIYYRLSEPGIRQAIAALIDLLP